MRASLLLCSPRQACPKSPWWVTSYGPLIKSMRKRIFFFCSMDVSQGDMNTHGGGSTGLVVWEGQCGDVIHGRKSLAKVRLTWSIGSWIESRRRAIDLVDAGGGRMVGWGRRGWPHPKHEEVLVFHVSTM